MSLITVISDTYICHLEAFGYNADAFENFIRNAVQAVKSSGAKVVAGSIGPYASKVISYCMS